MYLNDSCGTDAFLTKYFPVLVQSIYLLSLNVTLSAYKTHDVYIDLTYFIIITSWIRRISCSSLLTYFILENVFHRDFVLTRFCTDIKSRQNYFFYCQHRQLILKSNVYIYYYIITL
jgi:hypothetical protein